MKKRINLLITIGIFIFPALMISCSENEGLKTESENSNMQARNEEGPRDTYAANVQDEEQQSFKDATAKQTKKLIRKGNLTIESKHIEKSKARLDKALKSLDGYYDNEQFSKSNYEQRYSLKLRVPAKNFDRVLEIIDGGDDEIISKDIKTDDVSAEYVDIETRLKSKRAYLQRYEDFLSKAKTMDELLQIQEKIRALIEEIESAEARLSFLDDQVGYSTLNIKLYKPIQNQASYEEPGFLDKAQNSLETGWSGIVVLFLGLLSIWPLLLILIPAGIYGYKKLKDPRKSN